MWWKSNNIDKSNGKKRIWYMNVYDKRITMMTVKETKMKQ